MDAGYHCMFGECNLWLPTFRSLLRHCNVAHFEEKGCLRCPVEHCGIAVSSAESYRKHAQRMHVNLVELFEVSKTVTSYPNTDFEGTEYTTFNCETVETDQDTVVKLINTFAKNVSMFALRTREQYLLPKSTAAAVVADASTLFMSFFENVSSLCHKYISDHGYNIHDNDVLGNFLSNDFHIGIIWENVKTDARLKNFCKENLGLVEPVKIDLGFDEITGKKQNCWYVPVCETIKKYMEHDDVWASCNQLNTKSDEFLCDFADGDIFKQHGFFSLHPNALRLHVHTDDLELCNPLGGAKKKHCITVVYFQIGNLHRKHLSSLKSIHVALLVKSNLVKKYGYATVMKRLLDDIKLLETSGVDVQIDGFSFKIFGTIATVSADNLASHDIGGFRKCFSSGRVCRFCMVHYDELNKFFSESDDNYPKLRNQHEHSIHVEAVKLDDKLSSVYGVTGESVFAELPYFDVTVSLPPDCMHDILEGVIPFVLTICLKGLISDRVINVDLLNERLQLFKFGKSQAGNIPPLFSHMFPKCNLAGSASQKWCLFINLGFVIGDIIEVDNKYWKLYLKCRKLCELVFSPRISKLQISYLDQLISEHHSLLIELSEGKLTPKCHYLTHYPRLICAYGPLCHLWCMRFEGYHQYLKSVAQSVGNFKNICYTLAERNQFRKCLEQCDTDCLQWEELTKSEQKSVFIRSFPKCLQKSLVDFFGCPVTSSIITVKSAVICGIHYAVSEYIVIDVVDFDVPVFMKIHYIVSADGIWALIGNLVLCSEFVSHYHAYSVETVDEWSIIRPLSHQLHTAVDCHRVRLADEWKEMIALRHAVFQTLPEA